MLYVTIASDHTVFACVGESIIAMYHSGRLPVVRRHAPLSYLAVTLRF